MAKRSRIKIQLCGGQQEFDTYFESRFGQQQSATREMRKGVAANPHVPYAVEQVPPGSWLAAA